MKKIGPAKAAVLILILVLVTAAVAAFYLTTRTAVPEGVLRVEFADGKAAELSLEKLEMVSIQGTVVNGKGDERVINAQGILLSDVLREAGVTEYSMVTVTADDEYSARVTAAEITEPGKVYLTRQEEGSMQLIVFGDENSKRNVTNVVRLSVQ